MPFQALVDNGFLRFSWTGSDTIDNSWRFVLYKSRHGELYVRVDAEPWTYYKPNGTLASIGDVGTILGRAASAKRLIQQKITEKAAVKRQPSNGNPYGRFPEGVEMGILGRYTDMEDVDFTGLADGLGLRVLDEGWIEVYGGAPAELTDEYGHKWNLVSPANAYRPWAIYSKGDIAALGAPSADNVRAVANACKLPDVTNAAVTNTLDKRQFDVICTMNRKDHASQNTVMKNNSANDVAKMLGFPAVGWEWLHLIAFTLGGNEGEAQVPENLVLGTAAANTAMMCLEGFVKKMLSKGHFEKAEIGVVKLPMAPKCGWITQNIGYTVKFVRGGLPHVWVRENFNPLTTACPTYDIEEMIRQKTKGIGWLKSDPPPRPVSDTVRAPGRRFGRRL